MTDLSQTQKIENPTVILYEDGIPQSILVQKCRIIVVEGPRQGDEIIVEKDRFTMGGFEENDVAFKDATMSGKHCEVTLMATGYFIRDLESTNGTMVQGVRISEAFLNHGAEVKLGKTKFIFCPLKEATEIQLSPKRASGKLIGESIPMRRLYNALDQYADSDATVLIGGPTGSGKEVLAEEIHRLSSRKDKPFVVVDCTALSHGVIESELFGHAKGAFTNAHAARIGAFEHADGGTIFLDEIADMSLELQPKLLRVLEKREVRPLGSNSLKKIDVRIISATNKKLEREVNAGRFREDLYYRLSVVKLELPPLRQRKEDIPLLAFHFLKELAGNDAEKRVDLNRVLGMFNQYDWPGNVRELRNAVERFHLSRDGQIDLVPQSFDDLDKTQTTENPARTDIPFKIAKSELITRFEKDYLDALLSKNNWNVSQAAREAEIERAYLQRLIKKYDLRR